MCDHLMAFGLSIENTTHMEKVNFESWDNDKLALSNRQNACCKQLGQLPKGHPTGAPNNRPGSSNHRLTVENSKGLEPPWL